MHTPTRRIWTVLCCLGAAGAFAACNENEASDSSTPLNPQGAPGAMQPGQPLPPGHPTVGFGAKGGPEGPGELVASGSIEIAPAMQTKIPNQAMIFITARAAEQGLVGPPSLVRKLPLRRLPQPFELTTRDAMMNGPVPEHMTLQVRLDQDGDAISKMPGDLTGSIANVSKGATDVKILVTDMITEFKPGMRIDPSGAPVPDEAPAGAQPSNHP